MLMTIARNLIIFPLTILCYIAMGSMTRSIYSSTYTGENEMDAIFSWNKIDLLGEDEVSNGTCSETDVTCLYSNVARYYKLGWMHALVAIYMDLWRMLLKEKVSLKGIAVVLALEIIHGGLFFGVLAFIRGMIRVMKAAKKPVQELLELAVLIMHCTYLALCIRILKWNIRNMLRAQKKNIIACTSYTHVINCVITHFGIRALGDIYEVYIQKVSNNTHGWGDLVIVFLYTILHLCIRTLGFTVSAFCCFLKLLFYFVRVSIDLAFNIKVFVLKDWWGFPNAVEEESDDDESEDESEDDRIDEYCSFLIGDREDANKRLLGEMKMTNASGEVEMVGYQIKLPRDRSKLKHDKCACILAPAFITISSVTLSSPKSNTAGVAYRNQPGFENRKELIHYHVPVKFRQERSILVLKSTKPKDTTKMPKHDQRENQRCNRPYGDVGDSTRIESDQTIIGKRECHNLIFQKTVQDNYIWAPSLVMKPTILDTDVFKLPMPSPSRCPEFEVLKEAEE